MKDKNMKKRTKLLLIVLTSWKATRPMQSNNIFCGFKMWENAICSLEDNHKLSIRFLNLYLLSSPICITLSLFHNELLCHDVKKHTIDKNPKKKIFLHVDTLVFKQKMNERFNGWNIIGSWIKYQNNLLRYM